MPSEPEAPVEIEFTQEFKRNLRRLARKYRHIKSDLQPLLEQLDAAQTPGDPIQGAGGVPSTRFASRARIFDAVRVVDFVSST